MAAELLGAKMLAPFFGSSLYVWATVLAMTLGGLASGYFAGGIVSHRSKNPLALFWVLLSAAAFTVLMPFTAKTIIPLFGSMNLILSTVVSTLLFMFPPIFLMGMVSPLIIRAVTLHAESSGRAAGSVYAVSTVGGILSTFLMGFYVIPSFGLTYPAIFTGIILGAAPLFVLITGRKKVIALFFPVLCVFSIISARPRASESHVKVLYNKEGILGQVMVVDYPNYDESGKVKHYTRLLFVNRIVQSMFNAGGEEQDPEYVRIIGGIAEKMHPGGNALVLGLGGGTIAKNLEGMGFRVDACEFDSRIAEAAGRFFYLPKDVKVVVDDARHFIRSASRSGPSYDLVVFDLFRGEDCPEHVLTAECIEECKNLLNEQGIIVINGPGFWKGPVGKGMRSIEKTLTASGLRTSVLSTRMEDEMHSNLLFVASAQEYGLQTIITDQVPGFRIDFTEEEMNDALVLRDDRPVLNLLNAQSSRLWRQGYIETYIREFNRQNIPLFE